MQTFINGECLSQMALLKDGSIDLICTDPPYPTTSRGNAGNTEKPVALMEILINNSTKENEIVLDPFAGIASTLIACKKNNRQYIGFEIDKKYYSIGKDRLEDVI